MTITTAGWVKLIKLGLLVILTALLFIGYFLFTGPRMKVQEHIRAYQARMPLTPAGTTPVNSLPPLPTPDQAAAMKNPLESTTASIARGAAYYQYYACLACHGENGDGGGPVGDSYVPKPADLRSAKIRGYSDGQLLRGMLKGVGHEYIDDQPARGGKPAIVHGVLERIVLPEHRWYIVLYVRQFASTGPAETSSTTGPAPPPRH